MSTSPIHYTDGPFRAAQIKSGDPYELSNGHPIECLPSGGRHSKANLSGGLALETDPAVDSAGVDTGYASDPKNLRAPDIAVGNVPDEPGWVDGVPPLAVEYADVGQDETDLKAKIEHLLAEGTRYVWVVRMNGPRRVDVYAGDGTRSVLYPGDQIQAPGVLQNSLPVEALYDPGAAHAVALRNLLQRQGYTGLDAVRDEGLLEGKTSVVLRLLQRRVGEVSQHDRLRIAGLSVEQLDSLADALLDFRSSDDLTGWFISHGFP